MRSALLASLLQDSPIFVTGIGAFSAAGEGVSVLWKAALAGRSTAQGQEFADEANPIRFAVCAAPKIDVSLPEVHRVRKMDRCVLMARLAALEAWQQSEIAGVYAPERVGVMVGSSRGPLDATSKSLRCGDQQPPPSLAANTTFASISGAIANAFGCRGPGAMVSATCASAAFAIAHAAEQIVLGQADAMLVGGTEAALQPAVLKQLQATGVLGSHEDPEQICRPFDISRNGIVLGEGSAFLVLESAHAAARRDAPRLARLAGWAVGVDDSGRTGIHPRGSGLTRVMEQALQIAGLPPSRIDYINAHGSGTQLNDVTEARAVSDTFGETIPCTSTKPVTGHCLGATPALESVLCIETLRHQIIMPTANCHVQDARCPINVVPLKAQPAEVAAVMSNSLGFWGYHASLIFSAVDCP